MNKNGNISICFIFLQVLAALFLVLGIVALWQNMAVIMEPLNSGQLVLKDDFYFVVSFILGAGNYVGGGTSLFYIGAAVVFSVLGFIYQAVQSLKIDLAGLIIGAEAVCRECDEDCECGEDDCECEDDACSCEEDDCSCEECGEQEEGGEEPAEEPVEEPAEKPAEEPAAAE